MNASVLKVNTVSSTSAALQAGDMKISEVFRTADYKGDDSYMRVNPEGYLTNSSVVKSAITRGHIFVVQLGTGALTILRGDTLVNRVAGAELTVKG